MSRNPWFREQRISGTSAQGGSRVYTGIFSNCNFAKGYRIDALEKAADACRHALFLTDPRVDRENVISAKGTRVAGTCEWITQDAKYYAWLNSNHNSDTRLLWISGGPGKGKTMMSIFLTEELEKHIAHVDNAELAFFFCSAQDEKRNTAVAVLRGLVYQIITRRPQLVKHALLYFETPEKTQQTLGSLETLWIIFSELLADVEIGTWFCVLDGLDECEDSTLKSLLPRLVRLLASGMPSSTNSAFKLAIVSRDLHGLQDCPRVRLDPDNDEQVVSDIELFVSARVAELPRIDGSNEDFRSLVQTTLLQRAEGTFLWVGFAMYELLRKQTYTEILEALEDLPSGLSAIYSRMLLRIPAQQREKSQAILRWVTMAARPLQLRELAAAVGIRATPLITVEQVARDTIALCGPLLKVQVGVVNLVHQSARDYLLRKEEDSNVVLEAYRVKPQNTHLEIVQSSLDCIMQSGFQQRVIDLERILSSQESPLLQYAAIHWPEHARGCDILYTNFRSIEHFFRTEHNVRRHWWVAYKRNGYIWLPEVLPLLHMLCYLGFGPLIQAEVAWDSWRPRFLKYTNRKDSDGNTALKIAAEEENEMVVQLLIEKGADVNAKDNNGKTALYWAVWRDNEAVVQLLVENGADVNVKDNDGKTALYWAAKEENEVIVQLLVENGAEVNAKDDNGKTALYWAVRSSNEAIVRLLVGNGVDVNVKDNDGKTALYWSVRSSNEAIVRLLVENGADVNIKNNDRETALYLAALEGKEVVAWLLVENGADVNMKNNDGETPLHWAAKGGNEMVVQLLIEEGADVNEKDNDRKTALYWAVWRGNEAVVQLLVENGADVDAKDNDGKTALYWAAKKGNEVIVQLLVKSRADVNAKDNNGKTALYWAAKEENEVIVQLLVENGADVNAKAKNRKTALYQAAKKGNEVAVKLLVKSRADVNAKDNNGKTALYWAAKEENEVIVQLLVENGAEVNAKDNDGKTALYWAAWEGNETVVRLLVENGADVNVKNNYGETVLYWAAWEGNEAVVRLLVENGADVSKDNNNETAL